MDSLELPHWLILAGILLLIAGVTGLVVDRKKRGEVDDAPADEASSETRPQLPPVPDLLDSRPRRKRRRAEADGDPETKGNRD